MPDKIENNSNNQPFYQRHGFHPSIPWLFLEEPPSDFLCSDEKALNLSTSNHVHLPARLLPEVHPECRPQPHPLEILLVGQDLAVAFDVPPDMLLDEILHMIEIELRPPTICPEMPEGFPFRVQ
jgi:hypothetical protein